MLRTALGPAVAIFLEDPAIVEVMCQRRSKNLPLGRSKTRPVCGAGVGLDLVRSAPAEMGGVSQPGRIWPSVCGVYFAIDGFGSFIRWALSAFPARGGLLEAVAFAIELQDMNMMRQAVQQRAGETLAAKNSCPFLKRQIGVDDGRSAFVPLAEDLEEQFGAGLRERHIAEFVDDQQFDGSELSLQFEKPPFVAGFHQLMDERRRGDEDNRESALARCEPEREGRMGLASAAVAESYDVFAGNGIFASRELKNERLI